MENSLFTPQIAPAVGDAVTLKPLQANGREFQRFVGQHGTFLGVFANGMAYVQFEGQPYPCLLESLESWPNDTALDIRAQVDVEMACLGLRWRGPRLRDWMAHLAEVEGYPICSVADVPLPALISLLRKLEAEPTQLSPRPSKSSPIGAPISR